MRAFPRLRLLMSSSSLLVATCTFCLAWTFFVSAFSPMISSHHQPHLFTKIQSRGQPYVTTTLWESIEKNVEEKAAFTPSFSLPVDIFPPTSTFHTLEIPKHRPLGCTIEESMDPADDFVFVSKTVHGGFAEKAGLKEGDVIVAVTGLFGDMTLVLESGIEKIKSLVAAVPDESPLVVQVARGTGVLERHESAIVELCQTPGASDKEVESCVVDFLNSGYYDDTVEDANSLDDDEDLCMEDDADCLLDNMMNMWADELPPPPTTSGITDQPASEGVKKVKPWSSRSSPSGTYVRDPVTGQMRNIDA